MARIILDERTMKFSSLFESITRARLKNCFIDDIIIFVVEPGELFKAIGRQGSNVKRLENILKFKIKIVEYDQDLQHFIHKLMFPAKIKEITEENNIYTITPLDLHSRGLMIGRNAQNLRNYERILKIYFKIQELKVK